MEEGGGVARRVCRRRGAAARRTDVRSGTKHDHIRRTRLGPAQPMLASAVVAHGPRHQRVRVAEEDLGTHKGAHTPLSPQHLAYT